MGNFIGLSLTRDEGPEGRPRSNDTSVEGQLRSAWTVAPERVVNAFDHVETLTEVVQAWSWGGREVRRLKLRPPLGPHGEQEAGSRQDAPTAEWTVAGASARSCARPSPRRPRTQVTSQSGSVIYPHGELREGQDSGLG